VRDPGRLESVVFSYPFRLTFVGDDQPGGAPYGPPSPWSLKSAGMRSTLERSEHANAQQTLKRDAQIEPGFLVLLANQDVAPLNAQYPG